MRVQVVLDGASLSLEDLLVVARGEATVALSGEAAKRMAASRAVVEEAASAGAPVYGLTTGVAERKRVTIAASAQAGVSSRLIRGHRIAQGPEAGPELVRATMCVLANGLATAYPGVRPELAERVVEALNEGELPAVRTLGSVGEADLGPLADLAAGLTGTGFRLAAGEGLALIDNNAFSTAAAALAVSAAGALLEQLELIAALDFEAFAANLSVLHEVVSLSRPQPGI